MINIDDNSQHSYNGKTMGSGQDNAKEFFHSQENNNEPVIRGNVVLAIAEDRSTAYVIKFVLNDGSQAKWTYDSREKRNNDISTIAVKLNEPTKLI